MVERAGNELESVVAFVLFSILGEISLIENKKYCRLDNIDMKTTSRGDKNGTDYYRFFDSY